MVHDEIWLRKEILRVWGEYGVHMEVFDQVLARMDELAQPLGKVHNCPRCGTTQVGEEIPEENRECFGGATHSCRSIAYYAHDMTMFYVCPDCDNAWHRFPRNSPHRSKAEAVMSEAADRGEVIPFEE